MAFIVDTKYIEFFQELDGDKFQFIITDLHEFFIEELTQEQLVHRMSEELNPKVKISPKGIVKTLKTQPESCVIEQNVNELKIRLQFKLNLKSSSVIWEAEFQAKKSTSNLCHSFIIQLMKISIDNNVKINKMKQALEAKDEEIEEYKRNGGTLLRESLATEKFNFSEICNQEAINIQSKDFEALPTVLNLENQEKLCSLIGAREIDQSIEEKSIPDTQSQSKKSKKIQKVQLLNERMTKKEFAYEKDNDSCESRNVPAISRKRPSNDNLGELRSYKKTKKLPF